MSELGPVTAADALARAREREHELLDLLDGLVRTPSPVGGDGRCAQQVLAAYLSARGFDVRDFTVDAAQFARHPEFMAPAVMTPAVNLIGLPPGGRAARVLVFAHVDTRDDSPVSAPGLRRDAIRLYGAGVADDKAGLAASAVAAAILLAHGCGPTVLSAHAKGGGARGMLAAVERVSDVDAALYVHPAETGRGLLDIKHVSVGVIDVILRVTGWAGVEAEPGNPESVPLQERGNAVEACVAVLEHWRRTLPPEWRWNLGAVHGGEQPGTTPLEASARVRVLFDGSLTANDVLAALEREAARVGLERTRSGAGRSWGVAVTAEGLVANPAITAVDHPWYRTVRDATEAITGRTPAAYGSHLSSDIRFPIRLLGIPCVGIGPVAGNFQGRDEWVDLPDVIRTVAAIVVAVTSFHKEQSC